MNDTIRSILDRRSIRAYLPDPVSEEQIEALRQCAAAAPTAMNLQNWHFSFVTDKDIIHTIEKDIADKICASGNEQTIERIKSRGFSIFYEAPLVIFISADRSQRWSDVDAGIAVENLALCAHSLGLGSVIIGMADMAFSGEHGAEYASKLHFPEGFSFSIAIAIGKPAATKPAHEEAENRFSFI